VYTKKEWGLKESDSPQSMAVFFFAILGCLFSSSTAHPLPLHGSDYISCVYGDSLAQPSSHPLFLRVYGRFDGVPKDFHLIAFHKATVGPWTVTRGIHPESGSLCMHIHSMVHA